MPRNGTAATLILLLAACSAETVLETPEPRSAEATPTAAASPQPTGEPTAEPTTATADETVEATATPQADSGSLFAETDECTNDESGWTVVFPESWWTNTAFIHADGNRVPACWMFSADEFDPTDGQHSKQPGSGAEIHLQLVEPPGMVGVSGEVVSEEETTVSGYESRRLEWRGSESGATLLAEDDRLLQYVVSLPGGVEVLAFADSRRTDDYEEAVEVLDGIMERIEIIAP